MEIELSLMRDSFGGRPCWPPFQDDAMLAARRAVDDFVEDQRAHGEEAGDAERFAVALAAAREEAGHPTRFVRVPGGDHRSIQHDDELQDLTVRFLLAALA